MARCDTCSCARWDGSSDTTVWCRKKKKYIKVGRLRHLFAAAETIQHRTVSPRSSGISVGEVVKIR